MINMKLQQILSRILAAIKQEDFKTARRLIESQENKYEWNI